MTQTQISEEVRQDMDTLLNVLVPFAQKMIKEKGDFFPFGASMHINGKISPDGAYDNNLGQSQNLIDILKKSYQTQKQEDTLRASGICFDCKVNDPRENSKKKVDAIAVTFEHIKGIALIYYLPNNKGLFGKVKYGTAFACPTQKTIFV